MNIVHVSLKSLVIDGWSYQDNLLTKYHKRLGYNVSDITSHWIMDDKNQLQFDDRSDYINDDGVRIIRLSMNGEENYKRKLVTYNKFYETLESLKPDIIFIHSVSFVDIKNIVKYLKKHNNVTCYADNHADFSNSATNWISKNVLHRIIWRYYAQMLVPYVKKFYGVLPARIDFIVKMYGIPKYKCDLLVMGADDDYVEKSAFMRESIRKKYDIYNDDFLLLTGGKIDMEKQQTLLLMKAVQRLNNPKVKLIIYGSVIPELRKEFNELLNDNIIYLGWLKSSDIYNYIAASDVVIYPGRHSVLWEQTVAQGKPMIVKYWPGTTHIDMEGNVKYLYDDSAIEIERIIRSIIDNVEEYEKFKEAALSEKRRQFCYSRIAIRSLE